MAGTTHTYRQYFYLLLVSVAIPREVEETASRQAYEKVVLTGNFRTKRDASFGVCQRAVTTITTRAHRCRKGPGLGC